MKKYRLAKDLPFAKAGETIEVNIADWGGLYFHIRPNNEKCIDCNQRDFYKLISEGWIKEVKPREWHVVVNKFNDVIGYGNADKRVTEQYSLQNHGDRLDDFEIIHVQEVID